MITYLLKSNLKKWAFAIIMALLSVAFLFASPVAKAQTADGMTAISAFENPVMNASDERAPLSANQPGLNNDPVINESGTILINSTVEFDPAVIKDPTSQNNFYPGEVVNLMALIEAQGTGKDYENGHVKIFLDKNIFRGITPTDVSSSDFLKSPATIETTDTDYVINLELKTIPSGVHVGIPFLAFLNPGKIHNNSNYKIPSKYYSSNNDLLFETDSFSIHTRTDKPQAYGPGEDTTLDASYWDNNTLKRSQDVDVDGSGLQRAGSYSITNRTEPGVYTFSVQLPAGYKIPDGGSGSWTYDAAKNAITQKVTIDPSFYPSTPSWDPLGGFTLTIPSGYRAGTQLSLPMDVSGPTGNVSSTSYYVRINQKETPPNSTSKTI